MHFFALVFWEKFFAATHSGFRVCLIIQNDITKVSKICKIGFFVFTACFMRIELKMLYHWWMNHKKCTQQHLPLLRLRLAIFLHEAPCMNTSGKSRCEPIKQPPLPPFSPLFSTFMLTQQILLDENVQPWWFFASISNCNLQGGGKHEIGDGLICRKFEPQSSFFLLQNHSHMAFNV